MVCSCYPTNQIPKMCACVCLPPFFPHLDVLSEAFKGVNIKAFLAGLQAGDNLLGFNASWSDCQTREAAMEVLGKPRGCDLTTWLERGEDKGTTGRGREVRYGAKKKGPVSQCQPIPSLTFSLCTFFTLPSSIILSPATTWPPLPSRTSPSAQCFIYWPTSINFSLDHLLCFRLGTPAVFIVCLDSQPDLLCPTCTACLASDYRPESGLK